MADPNSYGFGYDPFGTGIPQLLPKFDGSQNMLTQPGVGVPVGFGTGAGLAGGIVGTAVGNPLVNSALDAAKLPGDAYLGNVDLNSPAGFGRAQNMAGMLMGGGMPMAEAGALGIGGGRLASPTRLAPDVVGGVGHGVRLAEEYVPNAPPIMTTDPKTGNVYPKKALSEQGLEVQAMRQAAQKEIDAGNYSPYFDPAQRYDVNPANYPPYQPTTDLLAKKPATQAKYDAIANAPEASQSLQDAFARGSMQKDAAGNWYYMGQLEDAFIKEYGPVEGPKQFKEKFADAMAATTGGADPTQNLIMAHYGNYMKAKGLPVPTEANEIPFPLGGGKYGIKNNMKMYNDMIYGGEGVTHDNPKRYNFSHNFLGNKGATMDEQMMSAFPGGMVMPPPGTYGHFENALIAQAQKAGVDPRYFQEVAWTGIKDAKKGGFQAAPMIDIVNQAIERTARITGLSPEEVVRRGLVRSEVPLYSGGGPGALSLQGQQQQ